VGVVCARWQVDKKSHSSKAASAPIKKQSMFASPDGVEGRVGFTGSGQGMTDYSERKKHKFTPK
jgi:survival of motor neuron-related-splicing factor 30